MRVESFIPLGPFSRSVHFIRVHLEYVRSQAESFVLWRFAAFFRRVASVRVQAQAALSPVEGLPRALSLWQHQHEFRESGKFAAHADSPEV